VIDEINDPQPQPDPAWDYYNTWTSLHIAKNQIDQVLTYIKDKEVAYFETDNLLRATIPRVIQTLQKSIPPEEPD